MRRSDAYRALVADAAVLAGAAPETEQTGRQHGVAGRGPTKLDDDWSPQQIAQWPRREHPGDVARRVSHESIYRNVSVPSRNVFDASMFHRLRSDRPIRRPRGKRCWHGRGRIRNMVCIHKRPTQADTREVAGHWEGDLVFAAHPSAVATVVDRATRYVMVVALPDGYQADAVTRMLIERMGRLPTHLRRSLTGDRGREMADHGVILAALSMPVFFCDPHHPWQPPMAARHHREHQSAACARRRYERPLAGYEVISVARSTRRGW